jgi:hypothetical protein
MTTKTRNIIIVSLLAAIVIVVYLLLALVFHQLSDAALKKEQDEMLSNVKLEKMNVKPCNICEEPLYSTKLRLPHQLKGYFVLEQAINCSKELNKPILLNFTGHGATGSRQMEISVWSDEKVLKRLREDFILTALYVDDKTIKLEEKDQYVNAKGKKIKFLGEKNLELETTKFKTNALPFYVIIDGDRKQMGNSQDYDLNVDNFVKFLDEGKAAFEKAHPKN